MPLDPAALTAAVRHLKRRDPILRPIITEVGPVTLKLERDRFRMLVRSITSQQISVHAARAIWKRLDALTAETGMNADSLAALPIDQLRTAGLSGQKAAYVHDLAAKVSGGNVRLHRVARMSDDEVIAELIQVKGIGVWTAQMFLMFSLGRLDVFPHEDLGIRSALRKLYGLPDLPDKVLSHRIAEAWRPYATIACWYCWRSHELEKAKKVAEVKAKG
jgi:DNA-3-methyladenine glycosylase II